MLISSRQNQLVKRFRQARGRRDRSTVCLDGWRLVREALLHDFTLESILYQIDRLAQPGVADCLELAKAKGTRVDGVTERLMRELSELKSPQGIIALVRRPKVELDDLLDRASSNPLLIATGNLRDPGNLGTVIRAAEAFGVTGLITLPGTVDPYSPKVVRASAASALRLPIVTDETFEHMKRSLKRRSFRLIATSPRGGKPPDGIDLRSECVLIAGGETHGLPDEILGECDAVLTIPHRPTVESMNVAVAICVLLYEAARQRGFNL